MSGAPEGYDALVLARLLDAPERRLPHLHVARDDARAAALAEMLAFFAPDAAVLAFPAWDCLPYDRASPKRDVAARRVEVLAALADPDAPDARPPLVLATVNAVLQRVPKRGALRRAALRLAAGGRADRDEILEFLARNGFERVGTVREPGEYAARGGIVDLFPPGAAAPLRLDLLGDLLDGIRAFDPATQRTSGGGIAAAVIRPASEAPFDAGAIARFRAGYREAFGAATEDPIYVAVSEGRRQIGMEHWLPLFHDGLETLFDYLPGASATLDHGCGRLMAARLELIAEYHEARRSYLEAGRRRGDLEAPPYRPLPPGRLYLEADELERAFAGRTVGRFTPFAAPRGEADGTAALRLGGRRAPDFAAMRAEAAAARARGEEAPGEPFADLRRHLESHARRGRRVVVAGYSRGSRARLGQLLAAAGLPRPANVDCWAEARALPPAAAALAVLPLEHGFVADDVAFLAEQDVLGERIARPRPARRRGADAVSGLSEISPGDLVVHFEHGIGRYEGLETLDVAGAAPHECLRILYAGNDRLYVPVENVDALSRHGSEDAPAALDRLGAANWQARKARAKNRLRELAARLIRVAAERSLRPAPVLEAPPGLLDEFAAGFPHAETDDQLEAIAQVLDDLRSGRPMDRLVCGDVGFGKTEVALRAAFAAAMSGVQVAVVAPTTLLCRQHYATFRQRFAGATSRIAQLSRLTPPKAAGEIRRGLAGGGIDIVVGTHALLGAAVRFADLGLLVVDEEQRFGVSQKERLKELKAGVHVLTLTATPIPRTFQLALSGVRDMSLIGTPPVDRLAVRTFVMSHDRVMIREAIMREHYRGGQTFYVCPRVSDIEGVEADLRDLVPEIRIAVAHGRMGSRALEDVVARFYDGGVDLLLCTQIVESGLDLPAANTMFVHRADMYGLAQLHQLRGRVGRAKLRAYCYLMLPAGRALTEAARKRLEVMQALDSLGVGFALASHDLDIRGAGNLLGDEQSGHVREVGVELYQQMLEEAVAAAKGDEAAGGQDWSPAIDLGVPVLVPERYVPDLDVRMGLYRRIARLEGAGESDSFAAELVDRFGPLPAEVENLLQVVAIKRDCRRGGISRLAAGPKGAVVSFRGGFADPAGLARMLMSEEGCQLRPDQTLVWRRRWADPGARLRGARELAERLAGAARKEAA